MTRLSQREGANVVLLALPPLCVTGLLWLTRLQDVTWIEVIGSGLLLTFAWVTFRQWRLSGIKYVSVVPVLTFAYWLYFGLAIFWGARRDISIGRGRLITEEEFQWAIIMAVCGILCLWLGMRSGIGRRFARRTVLDIDPGRETTWNYLRILLLLSLPLSFISQAYPFLLGGGGRQFLVILSTNVPIVIYLLLLRRVLASKAQAIDIFLIVSFLLVKALVGIASGWLGATAALVVVSGCLYLYERHKIPATGVVLLLCYIFFFQAGKAAFRSTFWGERVQAGVTEKVSYWSSQSLRIWQAALEDPTGQGRRQLIEQTLSRMSLLQQTANVLQMTPSVVPYQYGRLYLFMAVTLIPRAIWPEKPSVNEANQFYQVAYGLTEPDDLSSVSIAVGTLAESFINFGWFGLFIVMIPLGIFFDFFQRTFLDPDCGFVFNAIGLSLIPTFIAIESQLAQYLGGIVQIIVVSLLILAPVLRRCSRDLRAIAPQAVGRSAVLFVPPLSQRHS